ncbi:MAG: Mur ligase [Bacteroidota bacterium]|nr:Mur ligase [Bacteroidota bacterium]
MQIHFISSNEKKLQNWRSEFLNTLKITSKTDEISSATEKIVVDDPIEEKDNILKISNLSIDIIPKEAFLYQKFSDITRVVIAGNSQRRRILEIVLHTMNFYNIPVSYYSDSQINNKEIHFEEDAEFILLEGSHQSISFGDFRAKFLYLHPVVALINQVPPKEAEKYVAFIDSMTKGGILIYNEEDNLLSEMVAQSENSIRKIGYKTPDYQIHNEKVYLITSEGELLLENINQHSINDVEGAKWICQNMGIDPIDFYEALVSF